MEKTEFKQTTDTNGIDLSHIANLLLVAMGLVTTTAFATFMAWGGVIFALLAMIVSMPFLAIWYRLKLRDDVESSSILSKWGDSPLRQKIESVSERRKMPVVVAHRSSTQIVFANSKAKDVLGRDLVGTTVQKERLSPVKLVRMNGVTIEADSHPAVLLKNEMRPWFRVDVDYSTPTGEISFVLKALGLREQNSTNEDFLLYVLRPKNERQEAAAS